MEDAPLPELKITPNKIISEMLEISQENKTYKLMIEIEEVLMKFKIEEDDPFLGTYSRLFTLKEIKELHQVFSTLNSFKEFFEYLKALVSNKKINIKSTEEKILIILNIEHLLKQINIEIILTQDELNYKLISKRLKSEITQINEKIRMMELKYKESVDKQKEINNNIIEENNKIKEKLKNLEEENNKIREKMENLEQINQDIKEKLSIYINFINELKNKDHEKIDMIAKNELTNSSIMESEEYEMIKTAIKERMHKEIKELKKLYQATVDGGDASIFHKKCDNIPNTLTLIKSSENRRFGGFTSEYWESSIKCKYDKNAFLFSLDKKKIYKCKKDNYSICCGSVSGPCFGFGNTIKIGKNPLTGKMLRTFESNPQCSYEFEGDNHALSEDGKFEGVFAKEYEVFEVIFS